MVLWADPLICGASDDTEGEMNLHIHVVEVTIFSMFLERRITFSSSNLNMELHYEIKFVSL